MKRKVVNLFQKIFLYTWIIEILKHFHFSNYGFKVQFYQLFKGCQIDLLAGRMMENNQEVVISQNLALELYKAKHLKSMEQLIGMNEVLQLNKELSEELQIVGIAYAQNQDDYMIFLQEGTMENLLSHHHITNKDKVKYLFHKQFFPVIHISAFRLRLRTGGRTGDFRIFFLCKIC